MTQLTVSPTHHLRRSAPRGPQDIPQIKQMLAPRPAYLVRDQQDPRPTGQSSGARCPSWNNPDATLAPILSPSDRRSAIQPLHCRIERATGDRCSDVLVCAIDHQGIVRPGGAIQVPELRRTRVASAAAIAENLVGSEPKDKGQFVAVGMAAFAVKSIRHRAKYDRRLACAEHGKARVGQKREGFCSRLPVARTRRMPKPYRILPMATRAQLEQMRCQAHRENRRAASAVRPPGASFARYRRKAARPCRYRSLPGAAASRRHRPESRSTRTSAASELSNSGAIATSMRCCTTNECRNICATRT